MQLTAAPESVAPQPGPGVPNVPAVERAFQLGWSLAELKGRVATETYAVHPDQSAADQAGLLSDPLSHDLWRGSQWRVAFDRVSALHQSFDFRAVPKEALYDPGENEPAYLFPSNPPDYASSGAVWPDDPDNPILREFQLRETTRRGLNCLDLLYLNPQLALRQHTIEENQAALLQVLSAPQNGNAAAAVDTASAKDHAIRRVTRFMLTLLDTWDAYLREQFADVGWSRESEHNLVAYEAGRALASLSWNLTGEALPHEGQPVVASQSADPLELAWLEAFNDRNVSYLQHMLAVLGGAMDPPAAPGGGTTLPPSATIKAVIRSLDLWQRSIQWLCDQDRRTSNGLSATRAVDGELRVALIEQAAIWQALVLQQEDLSSYTAPGVTQQLYLDATIAVEQAIDPQQLAAAAAGVAQLGGEILNGLESTVHHALDAVVHDTSAAVNTVVDSLFSRYWPWAAGLLVLLVAMVVATAVVAGQQNSLPTVVSGVGSLLVASLGGLHLMKVTQQQSSQAQQLKDQVQSSVQVARDATTNQLQQTRSAVSSAISSAQSDAQAAAAATTAPGGIPAQIVGQLGAQAGTLLQYLEATGEKALANVQTEVQSTVAELERVIAISFPLIDYVVLKSRKPQNGVAQSNVADSSYKFLTNVIWTADDRRQELLQVASAAFGPLGVIALATTWKNGKH